MAKEKRRRLTRDEMEERLEMVYEMRLTRISLSTIGDMLKERYGGRVDKSMVSRDLKRLREKFKHKIRDYDPELDVGEACQFFEKVERDAYLTYAATRAATAKAGLLNTALRARELAIKLKQDFGLMRRVPQEFALKLYDKFDESEYPTDGGG